MTGIVSSSELSEFIRDAANRDPGPEVDQASQPVADAFRRRAISTRFVSTGERRPNGMPIKFNLKFLRTVNTTHLREQVFSELKSRLLDVSIDVSDMDVLLFAFMLPVCQPIARNYYISNSWYSG